MPGDDPDKDHRKHFPKCDFYMHRDEDGIYLFIKCNALTLGAAVLFPCFV